MSDAIASALTELRKLDEEYDRERPSRAPRNAVHLLVRRAKRFLSTGAADGSLLDDFESTYHRWGGREVPALWREAIEAKIAAAPKKKNGTAGRPLKYDWLDLSFDLLAHANRSPDPLVTREAVRRIVNKYIVDNWADPPEGSQIRDFVGRVCDKLGIPR